MKRLPGGHHNVRKTPAQLDGRRAIVELGGGSNSLAVSYHRGLECLKECRLSSGKGTDDAANQMDRGFVTFRKGTTARQIIERRARQLGIDVLTLRKDVELAQAVEAVVTNCGPQARDVMLNGDHPQSPRAILKISRKSRERQRYRIDGVAKGTFRSVGPQSSDNNHAPDTMDFAKILSRLARARGSIESSREVLESKLTRQLQTVLELVTKIQKHVNDHVKLLATYLDPPDRETKQQKTTNRGERRLTLDNVPRQLASALSLIAKNVSNMPTSSYDLRPTRQQRSKAEQELGRIRRDCKAIARMLANPKLSKR